MIMAINLSTFLNSSETKCEFIKIYSLVFVNIGLGIFGITLNSFVVVVYFLNKGFRTNIFYNLLFSINIMHIFSAVGIFLGYSCSRDLKMECAIGRVLLLGTSISSIIQTAMVSIDRFQSSRCVSRSVLVTRRLKLGQFSIVLCCIVYILFIVIGIVGYKEHMECTSQQALNGGTTLTVLRICFASSILICIFAIDIPLCMLTFFNIKRNCNTIAYNVSFRNSLTEIRNSSRIKDRSTALKKRKIEQLMVQAFKVVCLLVLSHFVTYTFQMLLFLFGSNIQETYFFKDLVICFSVINFLVDPLVCILTVRRVQRTLIRLFCRRKRTYLDNMYA